MAIGNPPPIEKIPMEQCVEQGGHCFVDDGIVLSSIPPQYPQTCKHCPAKRVGIPQSQMSYRYPEGQP